MKFKTTNLFLFGVALSSVLSIRGSYIVIRNLPAEIVMDTAFWTGRQ
ncbi:hypothetical protein T07_11816 [Trichinella nelsoni]|uniref:Uncharacterized protein n=1 Tax=Trichinella nelsoni TaxID=6336 RepID=A0A0V0RA57_9BILA|nr:hypothetical protein T07_11816 [Trichinella nelsoni]